MSALHRQEGLRLSAGLLLLFAFVSGSAAAQDVLRVYGAEGPEPAIREAAVAFGGNTVKVEVVTGPPDEWLAQAAEQADIVFASAGFMMAQFVQREDLHIVESSVTPLYVRPSAVLVRPGNPKQIHDFPDLMKPGLRVMVVSGSGQTGLWEDMAGKQGDIQMIRDFRKNIAVFAPNSTAAVKLWDERKDIDAYVTWNIWHIPLRDRATLVEVSEDYKIYRQCVVALTERGQGKALASRFIDFLLSPEGAQIFESWSWTTTPSAPKPLTVRNNIAIVCRIDKDKLSGDVGAGLAMIRDLVEQYRSLGTPPEELHISAVIHGDAAYWMLNDAAYSRVKPTERSNPNKAIVQELAALGVSLELCAESMKTHGWNAEDVLPGIKIVPNAYPRIVDLELQGYAYIRF